MNKCRSKLRMCSDATLLMVLTVVILASLRDIMTPVPYDLEVQAGVVDGNGDSMVFERHMLPFVWRVHVPDAGTYRFRMKLDRRPYTLRQYEFLISCPKRITINGEEVFASADQAVCDPPYEIAHGLYDLDPYLREGTNDIEVWAGIPDGEVQNHPFYLHVRPCYTLGFCYYNLHP